MLGSCCQQPESQFDPIDRAHRRVVRPQQMWQDTSCSKSATILMTGHKVRLGDTYGLPL